MHSQHRQNSTTWVSFCISTYKRPELLRQQLVRLCQQKETEFDIVVSDNDPEGSAELVCLSVGDSRIRYFRNDENLGMIPSFNLSVERSKTEFVVMVTDDDPIEITFLQVFRPLVLAYPDKAVYGGFIRKNRPLHNIELIESSIFVEEILNPSKTITLLWSSCILRRSVCLEIGVIPQFGSPHLADHAFIALVGAKGGGVVVNNMYSNVLMHDNNFSKFNFDYYWKGCVGFYDCISTAGQNEIEIGSNTAAARKYLARWFIDSFFNLKKYYGRKRNGQVLREIDDCASRILELPYMRRLKLLYSLKSAILKIKLGLGLVHQKY